MFFVQFPVDSDTSGGSFLMDLMEEDEYECDDDIYLTSPIAQLPLHSTLSDSQFLENYQYSSQHYHEDKEVNILSILFMTLFYTGKLNGTVLHVLFKIGQFIILKAL